jgi:hypothetical protein
MFNRVVVNWQPYRVLMPQHSAFAIQQRTSNPAPDLCQQQPALRRIRAMDDCHRGVCLLLSLPFAPQYTLPAGGHVASLSISASSRFATKHGAAQISSEVPDAIRCLHSPMKTRSGLCSADRCVIANTVLMSFASSAASALACDAHASAVCLLRRRRCTRYDLVAILSANATGFALYW